MNSSNTTQEETQARALFKNSKRIVIKIGTSTITRKHPGAKDSSIDTGYVHEVAAELAALKNQGKEVALVSSGAIGFGASELGLEARPVDLSLRQACAAIGQVRLMDEYRKAFLMKGLKPAQLLVTRAEWEEKVSYNNLRNCIETLFARGVIPIFNENDVVSTEEIGNSFGDNDRLSAYIATKIEASALLILSDVDGLFAKDPKSGKNAEFISYIGKLTPAVYAMAGSKGGSVYSVGGMASKLHAVDIAIKAGCRVIIAQGEDAEIIGKIMAGVPCGTIFNTSVNKEL